MRVNGIYSGGHNGRQHSASVPTDYLEPDTMASKEETSATTISVRPGVQILGILQHLNYKSWFALAEFVDNSIQSYNANIDRLRALHGDDFVLKVEIDVEDTDTPRIVVRDNAAGIASGDYQRAFRPADVPPDRTGLSEFGMGMKSAACWFSPKWRVRTKALGERESATITVDVSQIVTSGAEHIEVRRSPASADTHFTELTLESLHQVPRRRGIGKIRTYLADIYRVFLRRGTLDLRLNGEPIMFEEPSVLHHVRFDAAPGAHPLTWRKEIALNTPSGVKVRGFAGLLATGKAAGAGFALLRRDRLIQGLTEEGWKPEEIFGRPNSFRSQRLFGELFLEGVPVSHTKDGFRLEDHEEELIPMLREALDAEPLPLLEQAERLRVRPPKVDLMKLARSGADTTITVVERHGPESLGDVGEDISTAATTEDATATTPPGDAPRAIAAAPLVARRESRSIRVGAEDWQVVLELTDNPAVSEWVHVAESLDLTARSITIRFSLDHPFTQRFVMEDTQALEPLLRIACAIGLSQVFARKAGVSKAGVVLIGINDLLREVLCHD
jgi:hypothetical protein